MNQRTPYLDYLRVLAIIGIIAIHSINPSPYLVSSLFRFAVPLYVMISGALLLTKQETNYDFFKKRLVRLGIPLLVWSIIFSIGNSPYDYWFRTIFFGQPFYLLFVLLGLYLITPWLKIFLTATSVKTQYAFVAYLIVISTSAAFIENWLLAGSNILPHFSFTYFLFYLGYYVAGYLLHARHFKSSTPKLITSLVGSYILITLVTTQLVTRFGSNPKAFVAYDYLSLLVVVMTISVFVLIKRWGTTPLELVSSISKASFGMYFIHMLILQKFPSFLIATLGAYILTLVISKVPYLNQILGCSS